MKISHVFQTKNLKVPDSPAISKSNNDVATDDNDNDDVGCKDSTKTVPKPFNIEEDRKFLSLSMFFFNRKLTFFCFAFLNLQL